MMHSLALLVVERQSDRNKRKKGRRKPSRRRRGRANRRGMDTVSDDGVRTNHYVRFTVSNFNRKHTVSIIVAE